MWNIIKTIGVIVASLIGLCLLGVLTIYCGIRDIYREVKKPEGYDYYEGF